MAKGDKSSWDLITTLKMGRPLSFRWSYMKKFEKNLHTRDELILLDNKLVVPEVAWGAFSCMLHESHPGQFGMTFLAEYIWLRNFYKEKYHHGKSCRQCLKAGRNFKILWGLEHVSKLPDLSFANEKINIDFACPLDAFWGYILLHWPFYQISVCKIC